MTRLLVAGAAVAALFAVAGCAKPAAAPDAAKADTSKVADAVKADQAAVVAAFNAHDADKEGSHDASDIVAMGHGSNNIVGAAADLAALKKQFAADPGQHVTLSNESVDVAASGDMAVYHSTYAYTGTDPKTKKPISENGNYLVGYKLQSDGSWKMTWTMVSNTAPAAAPAAS